MFDAIESPRNDSASACASQRLDAHGAGREAQLLQQLRLLQARVGVVQRFGDGDLVRVGHDPRAAVAHGLQRVGGCGDDQVAGQDRRRPAARRCAPGSAATGCRPCARSDSTDPPFCAKPMKSSTLADLPSRCAAIAINAPTVTTPVPPTPVTSRSYGPVQVCAAGRGSAADVAGKFVQRRPRARRPACAACRRVTPTKLGQKPLAQE